MVETGLSAYDGFWPAMKRVTKAAYTTVYMLLLLYAAHAFWDTNMDWYGRYLALAWRDIGIIAVLGFGVTVVLGKMDDHLLKRGHPAWRWRPWGININFLPLEYAVLRVPFLVLLILNLPIFAWIEEFIIRAGMGIHPQRTLFDVCWRSAVFGLIHLFGGTKLGTCVIIAFAGLWFSFLYWYGDLQMATLGHLTFNIFGLSSGLYIWVRTGKNLFTS